MKKLLWIAVAILMASCSQKASDQNAMTPAATKVLKVAMDTTFPPMEFIDDNKQIVGFDVDLMNAIGPIIGYKPEFSTVDWSGIFAAVDNGNYDVAASSVTITDDRKTKNDFSDPYVMSGQAIVVPVADKTSTKLEDFVGKTVGVQLGTTGDDLVQKVKGIKDKGYSDVGLAFQDLANGNLAAVVIDAPVASNYALKNPNLAGKVKLTGTLLTSEPYGLCVKKGNTELLDALNKALAQLKTSGKLDELKTKWGIQ